MSLTFCLVVLPIIETGVSNYSLTTIAEWGGGRGSHGALCLIPSPVLLSGGPIESWALTLQWNILGSWFYTPLRGKRAVWAFHEKTSGAKKGAGPPATHYHEWGKAAPRTSWSGMGGAQEAADNHVHQPSCCTSTV